MPLYRYPAAATAADYARGLGGIALTGGPFFALAPGGPLRGYWLRACCSSSYTSFGQSFAI